MRWGILNAGGKYPTRVDLGYGIPNTPIPTSKNWVVTVQRDVHDSDGTEKDNCIASFKWQESGEGNVFHGEVWARTQLGNCGVVEISKLYYLDVGAEKGRELEDLILGYLYHCGYTKVICGVTVARVVQAKEFGWNVFTEFKNRRTGNQCFLLEKSLEKVFDI